MNLGWAQNKKRPRWARVLAGVAALALLGALLWLYTAFNGFPPCKWATTWRVRSYIAQAYPQTDYQVEGAFYNFKQGDYGCHVTSPSSPDTAFTVYAAYGGLGPLRDCYHDYVTSGMNTLNRLEQELHAAVEEIVAQGFEYPTRLVLCTMVYGASEPQLPLVVDMPFDLQALPGPAALTVWTSCQEPTWQEAARRLLLLKALMEEQGIWVEQYSLSLEYPYDQEGMPITFEGGIHVFDVPAQLLTDTPSLPQQLQQHALEWEAQHDKEKQPE